ncbi:MAG TPA: hypothetical protein VI300_24405, partial [Solirubrobacter sp.]
YASGAALDGLGAIYGVARRPLPHGSVETDDAFRRRLKSVVPLFTGGGTIRAIRGAVQSALGLPFDLGTLNVSDALRADLEELVKLEEFSPLPERVVYDTVTAVGGASELIAETRLRGAAESVPRIEWRFGTGSARDLTVERLDLAQGVRCDPGMVILPGSVLVLATTVDGRFTAVLDGRDVSGSFTGLAGGAPALPPIPLDASEWRYRARSAQYDVSTFDAGETFDLPNFAVEMTWTRYTPMSFDVTVPWSLETTVKALLSRYTYTGDVFVFAGLGPEAIPQVVADTRAAGVKGNVHFSVLGVEDHAMRDRLSLLGDHRATEDAGARDAFSVGSVNSAVENQESRDHFAFAAELDIATFDGPFGFV